MRKIDNSVCIAEGARVVGDVVLGKNSSVWFNAVHRGDEDQITVGEGTNIQDNCVLHCGPGFKVAVGNNVTVGHMTILHGCTVGDNTLVGMHSTIMNGAVIGSNCIVGAGSLVTEGTIIPDGSVALGRPARVIRKMTQKDLEQIAGDTKFYIRQAQSYKNAPDY